MNINKIAKKIMADKKVIMDVQYQKAYTLEQLKKVYEEAKRNGDTQAETFEDYLENITEKNGTCKYITEHTCLNCGKEIDDTIVTIDNEKQVCWQCAEELAKEAKEKNQEISIEIKDNFEQCHLCEWCDELYPESELRKEEDLGYLCNRCIKGIESRGEKLDFDQID